MKTAILILICLALAAISPAATEHALTFPEVLDMAIAKNPRVAIARNNARITRNNFHIGNADLLPELDLSGGLDHQRTDGSDTGVEKNTTTSLRLSVHYTLFAGMGRLHSYNTLRSARDIGDLEARDLIETILLEAAGAFYSAAAAFENRAIARELLQISEERLERARKRSQYGRARTIDVLSAQVDLITDQVTVTQAEYLWEKSRRDLNVLLNRDIQTEFTVNTEIQAFTRFQPEQLLAAALERNAAYLAAVEAFNKAGHEFRLTRSSLSPRLDLNASYGISRFDTGWNVGLSDPTQTFQIGAQLSFNLFNGFQDTIALKNARIAVNIQELAVRQARLALERDVVNEYESYRNSLLILDLQRKKVEAAEVNFKRTQELYQLGQVTTTQFREAQLNLIQARSNLATAKFDARLNEIQLQRLSGRFLDDRPVLSPVDDA